jgi:predicted phage gp36 major capsid-like protein
MSHLSEYERRKAENIARNRAILEKIDVARDVAALGIQSVTDKKQHASKTTRKRKLSDVDAGVPAKVARTKEAPTVATRRSQRIVGRAIDYNAERSLPDLRPARVASGLKELVNDGALGRDSGKRLHNP